MKRPLTRETLIMRKTLFVFLALIGLAFAPAMADTSDLWLHVSVDENDADETSVRVNVPLHLVRSLLPTIDVSPHLKGGKVNISNELRDAEIEGVNLREMWAQIKAADDGEYVTVKSRRENVRVAKEKGYFIIDVDETHGDGEGERVRVRMPLKVLEAAISEDGESIDLLAAIDALGDFQGEDLVRVEGSSEQVRIWIDRKQENP